jgi:hypothetical protein
LKDKEVKDDNDIKLIDIEFNLSMACLSILRYITDHLSQLSFPVRNHLMNVKDFPMLLVNMMETKPWIRKVEINQEQVFENKRWVNLPNNAYLPKLEAQVWISIFNLFMNQDNTKKYEISEFRKTNLIKLKKYMNENLFDAIPPLKDLFRALEEMSLMEYSSVAVSNPFVVQLIPQLDKFFNNMNIDSIKETIIKNVEDKKNEKEEYELIGSLFGQNNLEYFMEDPKCASCGLDANHRCSRCKSEWYCNKECQAKRWKEHKLICAQLTEMEKANNANNNLNQELLIAKESKKLDKKFEELD